LKEQDDIVNVHDVSFEIGERKNERNEIEAD